ncbi:hypothetical protein JKK33_14400 [Shewanella algae]|uniref:hypothetical protein n=1 Tax=Shewanella algae TaxID=38313 RepID=UPI001AACD35C|nr:hypothetical protein [Shewanella algae]QTE89565.1 hypothetical protein JKK33_14400 [Shewanella algae]
MTLTTANLSAGKRTTRFPPSIFAINIRLDADKLLAIPFTKRRMFEVKGMRSTYIVHESVAERLIALNASGLHLVPLLEWDMGFGFTI